MFRSVFKPFFDAIVTLLLWTYYFISFVFCFAFGYLIAALVAHDTEMAFQRLNCIFYRCFFKYLTILMPWVKISIAPDVLKIRSSVIICNHLSFLDPILLISLYTRHKTIVKGVFFRVPVFGWILRSAGYSAPSIVEDSNTTDLMSQVKSMRSFLASGGNLFIFPEGTRSRSGAVGPFEKGAFVIAKHCQAPVYVLHIENTSNVYPPGRFLFNSWTPTEIKVRLVGSIDPISDENALWMKAAMDKARTLFENAGADCKTSNNAS